MPPYQNNACIICSQVKICAVVFLLQYRWAHLKWIAKANKKRIHPLLIHRDGELARGCTTPSIVELVTARHKHIQDCLPRPVYFCVWFYLKQTWKHYSRERGFSKPCLPHWIYTSQDYELKTELFIGQNNPVWRECYHFDKFVLYNI
jgi:hypothetical protein